MRRLGLAMALVLLVGCGIIDGAPPLPLPPSPSIVEIAVESARSESKRRIVTPETIAAVLAILSSHNTGYRVPLDTFPTPQHTLVFRNRERECLVVWVGPDWLGGRGLPGSARDNRLRPLSAQDRASLLALVEAS
jgi:hypothetical protein